MHEIDRTSLKKNFADRLDKFRRNNEKKMIIEETKKTITIKLKKRLKERISRACDTWGAWDKF